MLLTSRRRVFEYSAGFPGTPCPGQDCVRAKTGRSLIVVNRQRHIVRHNLNSGRNRLQAHALHLIDVPPVAVLEQMLVES